MKRRINILLFLALCLTTIFPLPAFAASDMNESTENILSTTVDISDIELGEINVLSDGAILTPISQEEYVYRLADEKNISYEEAYELESQGNKARAAVTYYYDYSKVFPYAANTDFKAELQATLKIWSDANYRQIEDVLSVSSKRSSGVYNYSWVQTDAYSDPQAGSSSFPVTSVVLGAKGYFEVTTTHSVSTSTGAELEGFSFTYSSETTDEYHYISNTLSMRAAYSLY